VLIIFEVGYIFTEYFFDFFKAYISINILLTDIISVGLVLISSMLPYLVKYLIGYCHFYYQLGYGLIFYIYIYRRRKAKKLNNWNSFYGDSISNWILFNLAIFNKFIFNRNLIVLLKTIAIKSYLIVNFWIFAFLSKSVRVTKTVNLYNSVKKQYLFYNWTPLFKRTSYISFLSFLKRFSKRK
jgi:hypothetical protein